MKKKMTTTGKKKQKEVAFSPSVPVYDAKGKEVETVDLGTEIFDGKVHQGALHQAVVTYNANQRQGTASTKTISEVSGGGRKPWAQKGTGRARHASIRSPLWPGGGIIFGPHPRDHHISIPKKVKRMALISSLNSKLREKALVGISSLTVTEPKTKRFREILDALKLTGKTLFIVDAIDDKVYLASRNLREVALRTVHNFNIMDVLSNEKIVITRVALDKLIERLKTA